MTDILNTAATFINTDPFLLFFGSFYFVLGLSMFFAAQHWKEFVYLFIQHDSLSLVLGIMTLPISLFVIIFYNDWSTLASTVLMVMGYIGLIKAVILLLRPGWIQSFLNKGTVNKYLWLDGVSGIILGAGMLVL